MEELNSRYNKGDRNRKKNKEKKGNGEGDWI